MRQYTQGLFFPLIGYLRENTNVSLEELKKRYMTGASESFKDAREERFENWLKNLKENRVVVVEDDTVTFDENQWNRILKKINSDN